MTCPCSFTCLSPLKLSKSLWPCSYNFKWSPMIAIYQIHGVSLGAIVNIPPEDSISYLSSIWYYPTPSNGSGSPNAHPDLNFFAWLILMDRLNTKDMLQRRNFHVQPNSHCVMCNAGVVEDLRHLFFDCPFAAACWQKLGILWGSSNDIHTLLQ